MDSNQLMRQLNHLKTIVNGRPVVLFGAGSAAVTALQLLDLLQIRCLFLVDNAAHKWGQWLRGQYEIKPPSALSGVTPQCLILLTSSYARQMTAQLEQAGFVEELDFVNISQTPQVPKALQIFSGHYATFTEALADSTGYQVESYRDYALKYQQHYLTTLQSRHNLLDMDSQQMLLAVSLAAQGTNQVGPLHIVDFGGALGEHFYLVKRYLPTLQIQRWTVYETPLLTEAAATLQPEPGLEFSTQQPALQLLQPQPQLVIASGSLQFVADPVATYQHLCQLQSDYLFITRFPVQDDANSPAPRPAIDILSKLTVPAHLFAASYPSWHFSLTKWRDIFARDFELVASWQNHEVYYHDECRIAFYGFLLKRRPAAQQTGSHTDVTV